MFREMRRANKQLSREEAVAMLEALPHGVLAIHGVDGYPYAVPMSHAYSDGKLYFHGAVAGHKIDAFKQDDRASFCVIARDDIVPEKFTTHYLSAIAFGRIRILTDPDERHRAMEVITRKYSPGYEEAGKKYAQATWDKLGVFEMTIEHLTGKGVAQPK